MQIALHPNQKHRCTVCPSATANFKSLYDVLLRFPWGFKNSTASCKNTLSWTLKFRQINLSRIFNSVLATESNFTWSWWHRLSFLTSLTSKLDRINGMLTQIIHRFFQTCYAHILLLFFKGTQFFPSALISGYRP